MIDNPWDTVNDTHSNMVIDIAANNAPINPISNPSLFWVI